MKGYLILEDGEILEGDGFGALATRFGELVFNTSMTGYQEALTDPSYNGQILMMTYPLIGNYGVTKEDFESDRIHAEGFVVREVCDAPSNFASVKSVPGFLEEGGVPGLAGIDTRALTIKTRARGTLRAAITTERGVDPKEILERVKAMDFPDRENLVAEVSPPGVRELGGKGRLKVALFDFGAKQNIVRSLQQYAQVVRVPWDATAQEVFDLEPDAVFLSNGPGDPAHPDILKQAIPAVRKVVDELPTMGICLGHQLLSLAFGARTYKLKFGHRGANQPVLDTTTKRVFITSQNHGFAVDAPSAKAAGLEVTQLNPNDDTVEGMRHHDLPVFSVQYHPEACPGPRDTGWLFDEFMKTVR